MFGIEELESLRTEIDEAIAHAKKVDKIWSVKRKEVKNLGLTEKQLEKLTETQLEKLTEIMELSEK